MLSFSFGRCVSIVLIVALWSPATAQDRVMRYSDDHVAFNLPVGWTIVTEATASTPASFRSRDGKSQFTVTFQFFDPATPRAEVVKIFERYFDIRYEVERQQVTGSDVIRSFSTKQDQKSIWRTFAGLERNINRRFNGLIAAENGKLITFYIESLGRPGKSHNRLVQAIFGSVVIK